MAMYRKLGKKTKLRKALLRTQVTDLFHYGRITTTEARAKEVRKIAEHMLTLAIRERDNYETVTVQAKVAKKDENGKRIKEQNAEGKMVPVFDVVDKEIKKDSPSRLHARRQILKYLYPVVEVPAQGKGRKKNTVKVDLVAKMFDEYAPKYADRKGGYTRIVKVGQRRGDGAMEVILELV